MATTDFRRGGSTTKLATAPVRRTRVPAKHFFPMPKVGTTELKNKSAPIDFGASARQLQRQAQIRQQCWAPQTSLCQKSQQDFFAHSTSTTSLRSIRPHSVQASRALESRSISSSQLLRRPSTAPESSHKPLDVEKLQPLKPPFASFNDLYTTARGRATKKQQELRAGKPQGRWTPSENFDIMAPLQCLRPAAFQSSSHLDMASQTTTPSGLRSPAAKQRVSMKEGEEVMGYDSQATINTECLSFLAYSPTRNNSSHHELDDRPRKVRSRRSQELSNYPTIVRLQKQDLRDLAAEKASRYIRSIRHMVEEGDFRLLESAGAESSENTIDEVVPKTSALWATRMKSIYVDMPSIKRLCGDVNPNCSEIEELEHSRNRMAFSRFKSNLTYEIEFDQLPHIMFFLGHFKAEYEPCRELAYEISGYNALDFHDFVTFTQCYLEIEHAELKKDFDCYDVRHSGSLNFHELRRLLDSLGVTPDSDTLKQVMNTVDFDCSRDVTFQDFLIILAVYSATEGFTCQQVCDMKAIYDRVGVSPKPGMPKEVNSDTIEVALTHMFGFQSAGIARKISARIARGYHHDLHEADLEDPPGESSGLSFAEFLIWARRLRQAEIREYREQIALVGSSEDNDLILSRFGDLIRTMGFFHPLNIALHEILKSCGCLGTSGAPDFYQIVDATRAFQKVDGFTRNDFDELKAAFCHHRHENPGTLFCGELMEILRNIGYCYTTTLDAVRDKVQIVDVDQCNRLDFPEFVQLMRMIREEELRNALDAFEANQFKDRKRMPSSKLRSALESIGYNVDTAMLKEVVHKALHLERDRRHRRVSMVVGEGNDWDFEDFAFILDECRRRIAAYRRQHAGFSDNEIKIYKKAFQVYDDDSNKVIERHELSKLLEDIGLGLHKKDDLEAVLEKMDLARNNGKEAGVDDALLGSLGDVTMTFHCFLFLIRNLHKIHDLSEFEHDVEIMQKTKFSRIEVQGFRRVFSEWASKVEDLEKVGEIDFKRKAPSKPHHHRRGSFTGVIGELEQPEDLIRHQYLSHDGMRRVVKAICGNVSSQETKKMDEYLSTFPVAEEGMYNFSQFLLLMRWLLDSNFGCIDKSLKYLKQESSDTLSCDSSCDSPRASIAPHPSE